MSEMMLRVNKQSQGDKTTRKCRENLLACSKQVIDGYEMLPVCSFISGNTTNIQQEEYVCAQFFSKQARMQMPASS